LKICSTALLLSLLSEAATAQSLSAGTLLAPKAFRAALAKVQPSIVRIDAFGGIDPSAEGGYPAPGGGPTTGLIISTDGYILTSTFNFLRKPPIITVTLANGRRHVAQLWGSDETRRICLLKVDDAPNLPVPQFAPREELKVGQWAIAAGLGFTTAQPAISVGIISATHRLSDKAIQTDANTSPATYGGPLIDLDGRVIGVCTPVEPGSENEAAGAQWYDSGIGFAIPIDRLGPILDRLKKGETLRPAFFGVQAEPFGDPPNGAQVKEVLVDSPAAKAGLKIGDKLLKLGDTEVLDVPHLATVIHRYLAGDKVEVVLQRDDKRHTLTVEFAPPPPVPPRTADKKAPSREAPAPPDPGRPKPSAPPRRVM
jgi:serine protease Do